MTGDRTSHFARIYIHLYPGGLSLHYTPINASVLRHWNTSAAQADLAWRRRVHLRGGYVFEKSEVSGPSIGLGISVGGLFIDLARLFEGFSPDASQAPTYVSLRYLF